MSLVCKVQNPCASNAHSKRLIVKLTGECTAKCKFCIKRENYPPKNRMYPDRFAKLILKHPAKFVTLSGGDCALYPHLEKLIEIITNKKVVTLETNGVLFTELLHLFDVSLLDHIVLFACSPDEALNKKAMRSKQPVLWNELRESFGKLLKRTTITITVPLYKGFVDDEKEVIKTIYWAKGMGANKLIFEELQDCSVEDGFISARDIPFFKTHGLVMAIPFHEGCLHEIPNFLEEMSVYLKQVCGLVSPEKVQTGMEGVDSSVDVLYPNGTIQKQYGCLNKPIVDMTKDEEEE